MQEINTTRKISSVSLEDVEIGDVDVDEPTLNSTIEEEIDVSSIVIEPEPVQERLTLTILCKSWIEKNPVISTMYIFPCMGLIDTVALFGFLKLSELWVEIEGRWQNCIIIGIWSNVFVLFAVGLGMVSKLHIYIMNYIPLLWYLLKLATCTSFLILLIVLEIKTDIYDDGTQFLRNMKGNAKYFYPIFIVYYLANAFGLMILLYLHKEAKLFRLKKEERRQEEEEIEENITNEHAYPHDIIENFNRNYRKDPTIIWNLNPQNLH